MKKPAAMKKPAVYAAEEMSEASSSSDEESRRRIHDEPEERKRRSSRLSMGTFLNPLATQEPGEDFCTFVYGVYLCLQCLRLFTVFAFVYGV